MTTRCIQAVKKGDLNELQRLVQAGHPLNRVLVATSVAHEKYHIYEWLKEQGCDTMGVEIRKYENGITGVGLAHTLDKNEKRFGLRT
ncbi:Hypothetical protein ZAZAV_408 [Cedratvirus Zaza IHUMI]|uniref:Ankyrin repeat-containing protein n=2 Tax=Pithoviruses TaxID=2023203 RepID=A0A2R8FF84_9VIRU|nr:Hypothetical protein ZAZAV_408 [Cedratvirus Zaza IHUMI]